MLRRRPRTPRITFRSILATVYSITTELAWLHHRRLRDVALADLVLVPSDQLQRPRSPRHRPAKDPRGALCRGLPPLSSSGRETPRCGLHVPVRGGITQRKGIKYLLEAWNRCAGRAGSCNSSVPCQETPGRSPHYLIRSNCWATSLIRTFQHGWPRRTCSCSPHSSKVGRGDL